MAKVEGLKKSAVSKKKKEFPHVYIILLGLILIATLCTYVIPAGQFNRVESKDGIMVVDPDSYTRVEQSPVGLMDMLTSIPEGMVETAEIIFFIFVVGGAFAVLEKTGAIEAGIGQVTNTMQGNEKIIIPVIMILFSLGGAVFGMAEETLPFIPIMVTLAMALGYDSLTGAGMVLAGAGAGFSGAFINPFTVGVAQGIAGLPLFSGLQFRIIMYITMVTSTTIFIYLYAMKVKANPEKSIMYEIDKNRDDTLDIESIREIRTSDKLILLTLVLTIGTLVYGVVKLDWYIQQIAALFLGMSVVVSIIGKIGFNEYANELVDGMASMAGGALIVGFARAILIVLTKGEIMDTILFFASTAVCSLPSVLTALGMYIFQCLLNFIIPSGSGQAAVSIPIMAPLADLTGVTRQTAVIAYQLGDGISNIFSPTSGFFMAGLALAKVPWEKWIKWYLKLALMQYAIGAIFVTIAHIIQIGPF